MKPTKNYFLCDLCKTKTRKEHMAYFHGSKVCQRCNERLKFRSRNPLKATIPMEGECFYIIEKIKRGFKNDK